MTSSLPEEREKAVGQQQKTRGFQLLLAGTTALTGDGVEMATGSIQIGVDAGGAVGVTLIEAAHLTKLYQPLR